MSNNIKLREYKQAIAAAIRDTRKAYDEALDLLNEYNENPGMMRDTLEEMERHLSNLESEIACMEYSYTDLLAFISRLNDQRDEAIKQRNILARQLKIEQKKNADFKFSC